MLPTIVAPRHSEDCQLKESEKWQKQEVHSESGPACLSSLKQVMKLPRERYPPSTRRKTFTRDEELGAEKSVQIDVVNFLLSS